MSPPARRRPGISGRLALPGLSVLLALAYVVGILLTTGVGGSHVRGDGRSYFAYLPSLVLNGDLDLRSQFRVLQPEGDSEYPFGPGRDGRALNPFPVAPALMWLPGYLAGLGIDLLAGTTARTGQPFGYGAGAVLGAAVWSILLTGVGASVTRRLVQRAEDRDVALAATVMAWVATPALYYTLITPLYSHAAAWVAVAFMLWTTWRATEPDAAPARWLIAGLAGGWVVAVRLQDAPLLVVPLLLLLTQGSRLLPDRLRSLAAWAAGAGLGYMVQGLTWYWLAGTWRPPGSSHPLAPLQLSEGFDILFSTGYRGWISWTPIVLPALAGLVLVAVRAGESRTRWLAGAGLIGIAGIFLLDVTHPFGAGASFGARRYVSVTPLLALGLAALLGRLAAPRLRAAAWIALPALTVWNLGVLLSYQLLIHRHGVYPTLRQVVRYATGLGPP